jgi:hypothetical protein
MLSAHQARDLGDGLRRLRQRKRLTRYQAAELSELPHLVYARLELGQVAGEDAEDALMCAWGELQVYRPARVAVSARREMGGPAKAPRRARTMPIV